MKLHLKLNQSEREDNFVAQAGILAVAGIISRIIGLLYRSPLTAVIGPLGNGYYSMAYEIYTIVLLISSYSIPSAISKVIAQKLAVGEYRNAHRIFRCALAYVLVVGGVASLVLFFGAGAFVAEEAVPVLRVFAPTVFVYGMLGVLRGYFQAHKTMVQTSVSQILEQLINAVVSVGAAWLIIRSVMGTLEVPAEVEGQVKRAASGAVGSALGTGAGVLIALVFMAWMYRLNAAFIHRRVREDAHGQDSLRAIFGMITAVILPFILSTAVYNLSSSLNMTIYTKWYPALRTLDDVEITHNYGVFSGLSKTIANIPIAFASAMASAMIPSVSQLVAAGKVSAARERIALAVKTTMLISIPSAAGLFALGKPLNGLLFPSQTDEVLTYAGYLLMALAPSVIFFALSTLSGSILQGLGRVNAPIVNAAVALVLQTAVALILLLFTGADLYALPVANTVYAGLLCILNQISIYRAVGYRQEIRRTFLLTALAAAVCGGAAWGVYRIALSLTGSMRISVLPAVFVAVLVYAVVLLAVKGMDEKELRAMPKGELLVRIARKCHML